MDDWSSDEEDGPGVVQMTRPGFTEGGYRRLWTTDTNPTPYVSNAAPTTVSKTNNNDLDLVQKYTSFSGEVQREFPAVAFDINNVLGGDFTVLEDSNDASADARSIQAALTSAVASVLGSDTSQKINYSSASYNTTNTNHRVVTMQTEDAIVDPSFTPDLHTRGKNVSMAPNPNLAYLKSAGDAVEVTFEQLQSYEGKNSIPWMIATSSRVVSTKHPALQRRPVTTGERTHDIPQSVLKANEPGVPNDMLVTSTTHSSYNGLSTGGEQFGTESTTVVSSHVPPAQSKSKNSILKEVRGWGSVN